MAELQKFSPAITVLLNGVQTTTLKVLEVGRSQGGRSLDYAEMIVAPHPTMGEGFNVQDLGLLEDLSQRQCTIQLRDETGSVKTVHWGYVDAKSLTIDRSERQIITSRLQPYHFGQPIRGMRVYSPFTGGIVDSLERIVFNPQLDGYVANNRSGQVDPSNLSFLFIHPECQRSAKAIATAQPAAGGPVGSWSLAQACHYLCWAGNAEQTHILNPTLTECFFTLPASPDILRNHPQPFGEYLPANLDALLEPYGFSWKIDLSGAKPKINVFRRGSGAAVSARLAPADEWADFATSNAEEINVTTDVANSLANSMEVYGDNVMIESTWELVPAWDPAFDGYPAANAELLELHGGPTKAWEASPGLSRVWRDWVLNEAGDYTGNRAQAGFSSFYNFNNVLGMPVCFTTRRRRFLPCVTLGADGRPIGEHHGVEVEYFRYDRNPLGTDLLTTGSWQPVEKLSSSDTISIQVLDKECGIRFAGLHIPVDLAEYGITRARIRVTATVEMDVRVGAVRNAATTPNIHRVTRVLDVGSRFKERRRINSKFQSMAAVSSTFLDDRNKADALAIELLANWNQASINGTITLPGVDWAIANDCVGKPFSGITGRGISFQTTAAAPAKYPSITAVKLDFVNQKTVLSLDTYRRDNV